MYKLLPPTVTRLLLVTHRMGGAEGISLEDGIILEAAVAAEATVVGGVEVVVLYPSAAGRHTIPFFDTATTYM